MLDRLDKESFVMEEIEEAMELMEQRLHEQVPIEICHSIQLRLTRFHFLRFKYYKSLQR